MGTLSRSFPFHSIFKAFLDDYARKATYWYVPKARVLNDRNVDAMAEILKVVLEEFLGCVWNVETQDAILTRLSEIEIVRPPRSDSTRADRTALIRIWKKLFDTLGLLWIQDDKEIVITDAGLDLLSAEARERRQIVEKQIIKYQYRMALKQE